MARAQGGRGQERGQDEPQSESARNCQDSGTARSIAPQPHTHHACRSRERRDEHLRLGQETEPHQTGRHQQLAQPAVAGPALEECQCGQSQQEPVGGLVRIGTDVVVVADPDQLSEPARGEHQLAGDCGGRPRAKRPQQGVQEHEDEREEDGVDPDQSAQPGAEQAEHQGVPVGESGPLNHARSR